MCHKMRKTGKQYAGPSFISQVTGTHMYCWDQGDHCNCNAVPGISECERARKDFFFIFLNNLAFHTPVYYLNKVGKDSVFKDTLRCVLGDAQLI